MQSYGKGSTSVSYKYDGDGLRTQKTVNGTVYDYYYVDGQLVYEKRGDALAFYYCYDANGNVALIRRVILATGAVGNFYTILNAQGDVVGLRNYAGTVLAKYTYDSWGKLVSITDGNGTPLADGSFAHQMAFRYRGYYYDTETGLYYLQSRYYDPETGRFLNADEVDYIGATGMNTSYNAFEYCENNPITWVDPSGFFSTKRIQTRTMMVKMLELFLGGNISNKQRIFSFNKGGIKLYIETIMQNTFNPDSYFKISKNGISVSRGGMTMGVSGKQNVASASISYKGTSITLKSLCGRNSSGKLAVAFGFVIMQSVRYTERNFMYSLGVSVMLEITVAALAVMTATVVATCYFAPQLTAVLSQIAKGVLALYNNPAVIIGTGKVIIDALTKAYT